MADTTTTEAPSIRPFQVNVPDEELAEMRRRITATRWPSKELVADRSQGGQLATLQALARYWTGDYDWRNCEAKLNAPPAAAIPSLPRGACYGTRLGTATCRWG